MSAGSRLLGREEELGRLCRLLDEAVEGHQQLALVSGDAGIGKTSLVAAFAADAAAGGCAVVWGRCWEGGGAPPFWPWVQVLRSCLDHAASDVLGGLGPAATDLSQLVPELGGRLPGPAPGAASDGPDARLRLFESVGRFLSEVAGRAPLVVVLDDVHAADEGSLQLLRYLARRAAAVPLVLVATYRITEVVMSEVHSVAVDALSRLGPTLRLRGLATDEVGALLERAGAGLGSADVRRVHVATDGNPFLVYEAARLLAAAAAGGRADVVLPSDARALIHRRLEPVPPDQRRVLAAAAVLGREFDVAAVCGLAGIPAGDLIDLLGAAAELAVVEEVGLGRWSFTHALLREALRDDLDPFERARLHARAGEVLRSVHGDGDGPVVAQVAEHLFAALDGGGDPARAVAACARAAEVACGALAHEEACRWYERALGVVDRMEPVDERLRYDLLVSLAEVTTRRGNAAAAAEAHRRAIRAARAMGSVELAARAAVQAAPLSVSDPLVIGALDDALCDLPDEDSPLRARVLVAFARVLSNSYLTRDVLLDISRQGLEMARRVGDAETQWWTLWQWHQNALGAPGLLDERQRVADELMGIADRSGDLERRQLARQWRAVNLLQGGDLAGARAELQAGLREAEELRQPFHRWQCSSMLASVAITEGRLEEGEHLARRAVAMAEELDWVQAEVVFTYQLLILRRHQGAFEELDRLAATAMDTWTMNGWECARQSPVLLSLIHRGQTDEARARFDKALGSGIDGLVTLPGQEDVRVDLSEGRACCSASVAELCWLLGDADRARLLYDPLVGRTGEHVVSGDGSSRGVFDRYLGQLATLLGRLDEADGHFEAGHRLHDRMGIPIWGAYGRADHARMLEIRDAPGDRARAVRLLTDAAATFARLGMGYYERKARERLDALVPVGARLVMRREGESWAIAFAGPELRVRDTKGIRYLARLVANPGEELHALDLVVGDGRGSAPRPDDLDIGGSSDAGAVLDTHAKAAYRRRLEELRRRPEGEEAQREIAFLERELDAAVGLGGRDRRAASDAERARQSVTKAVKEALDRLSDADPALGRHLRDTVRTGIFSSYAPG